MSDIDPTEPTPPVVVPSSPAVAQANTLLRDILIILAVIPSLMAVLGTRDVFQIIAYIQSVEFAPALGVIVLAAVTLWRQIHARRTVTKGLIMNAATPITISGTKAELRAAEVDTALDRAGIPPVKVPSGNAHVPPPRPEGAPHPSRPAR